MERSTMSMMSTKLRNGTKQRSNSSIGRALLASIAGACVAIGAGSSTTHAAAVTYTFTMSGFSGNYGTEGFSTGTLVNVTSTGTQFTNGVLTFSVTTDTSLIAGSPAADGNWCDISNLNGTAFSFSLTGTGLSGTISGTFAAADTFRLYSGTSPLGNGNFLLENNNVVAWLMFMRPGILTGAVPTYTTFANNYSATVNRVPGSNSATTAPNDYLGGSNAPNWDWTTANLYQAMKLSTGWMTFTSGSNDFFSGSWSTVVASGVPGSGLACLGSLGLAGFARRRR
ncbi:MAG: hypothetical protein ACO3NL_01850 [Phycisphaerales bacterium]